MVVTESYIMCLDTFSVLCPVNILCYFLLKSMVLMVQIPNSWVYGLPAEKTSVVLLVGSTLIFEPSTLEKGTTKLLTSVDQ